MTRLWLPQIARQPVATEKIAAIERLTFGVDTIRTDGSRLFFKHFDFERRKLNARETRRLIDGQFIVRQVNHSTVIGMRRHKI